MRTLPTWSYARVATLVGQVEDEAGPIDVLVNNAGIGAPAAFTDAPDEDLRQVTQVNYLAPAELCRQIIPRMLGTRRRPHCQHLLAGRGLRRARPCQLLGIKAALSHFTAGLRADFRGLPIGTTLVEIGPIPTEMLTHTGDCEPTAAAFRRFYRLRLAVDVPREKVADEVVEAVQKGRRHVRIPKRMALNSLLGEAPRRITEVMLSGVPHQVT